MNLTQIEMLPPAQQLALAYLGQAVRTKLEPAFALDFRLSRIVGTSSEPILAQMRIAWWRDMLGIPIEDRPQGDAVLTGISENWRDKEAAIYALLDAWEELLLTEKLDQEIAGRIAEHRGAFLVEVMQEQGGYSDKAATKKIATRWALADFAAHCSADEERDLFIAVAGKTRMQRVALPRKLRGIAVLDALALDALKQGGRPLAEGRRGAFVALRVGLLGR